MNKFDSADEWTVAVISRAQDSPQTITQNGKASVVIVSVAEWEKESSWQGSFASFLMQSPLGGAALDLERDPDPGREFGR